MQNAQQMQKQWVHIQDLTQFHYALTIPASATQSCDLISSSSRTRLVVKMQPRIDSGATPHREIFGIETLHVKWKQQKEGRSGPTGFDASSRRCVCYSSIVACWILPQLASLLLLFWDEECCIVDSVDAEDDWFGFVRVNRYASFFVFSCFYFWSSSSPFSNSFAASVLFDLWWEWRDDDSKHVCGFVILWLDGWMNIELQLGTSILESELVIGFYRDRRINRV